MLKRLVILCLFALAAFAQTAVNQIAGPPPSPFVDLYFYDGSSNLQYDCRAPQNNAQYQWTKAGVTNVVDSSNTATITFGAAHGLYPGARITLAGITTDTDLNGTYTVLTTPLSTTATITTASVTDGTYTDAGLTILTNWPRTTVGSWAIKVFTYSSGALSGAYWAGSATTSAALKCSDRANY